MKIDLKPIQNDLYLEGGDKVTFSLAIWNQKTNDGGGGYHSGKIFLSHNEKSMQITIRGDKTFLRKIKTNKEIDND